MQIIQNTTKFEIDGKCAAAIGKFDGIHLGHQKLLKYILEQKEEGQKAVIFTFDPPPSVLFGNVEEKELMTKEEKREAFEKMGIDVLIEFPLSRQTAAIAPEDFIADILVRQIHAKYIAAGTDVTFGNKGIGNCMLLSAMAGILGYQVEIIDKVCFGAREVSSTYVREVIESGNMEEAAMLLGKPYGVSGFVQYGNHFGRTIGMPTLNLLPPASKLLPPNGVYYSVVEIGEDVYPGITNIGCKPTVSDDKLTGVETYLYGFDKEVYGEKITVRLLTYKRPEIKFANKEELAAQMEIDKKDGYHFHEKKLP